VLSGKESSSCYGSQSMYALIFLFLYISTNRERLDERSRSFKVYVPLTMRQEKIVYRDRTIRSPLSASCWRAISICFWWKFNFIVTTLHYKNTQMIKIFKWD